MSKQLSQLVTRTGSCSVGTQDVCGYVYTQQKQEQYNGLLLAITAAIAVVIGHIRTGDVLCSCNTLRGNVHSSVLACTFCAHDWRAERAASVVAQSQNHTHLHTDTGSRSLISPTRLAEPSQAELTANILVSVSVSHTTVSPSLSLTALTLTVAERESRSSQCCEGARV